MMDDVKSGSARPQLARCYTTKNATYSLLPQVVLVNDREQKYSTSIVRWPYIQHSQD
jgi:hypothetical protein